MAGLWKSHENWLQFWGGLFLWDCFILWRPTNRQTLDSISTTTTSTWEDETLRCWLFWCVACTLYGSTERKWDSVQRDDKRWYVHSKSDDTELTNGILSLSLSLGAHFQVVEGKFLESTIRNEENIFTTTIYLCQFIIILLFCQLWVWVGGSGGGGNPLSVCLSVCMVLWFAFSFLSFFGVMVFGRLRRGKDEYVNKLRCVVVDHQIHCADNWWWCQTPGSTGADLSVFVCLPG